MLNLMLLVGCLCLAFVLVLYLFYWNRFVAYLVGVGIRLMYWNQGDLSIWVEIGMHLALQVSFVVQDHPGSIHFSLLAGRILLKEFQYHSSNQTVKVVNGQIIWRYWIRNPTRQQDVTQARTTGGSREYLFDQIGTPADFFPQNL